MGKNMHFMSSSRIGASSCHTGIQNAEPRCPATPIIRPVPLLLEPPKLYLSEPGYLPYVKLEVNASNLIAYNSQNPSNSYPSTDEYPIWALEFHKKAAISHPVSKKANCPHGSKKQNSSNLVLKFFVNNKKLVSRGGHR